jgi:hypothetical protein
MYIQSREFNKKIVAPKFSYVYFLIKHISQSSLLFNIIIVIFYITAISNFDI